MIELPAIEAARERIAGAAVRTPLVRLYAEDAPAEIYLKLEPLQPINSFKIRGATNAIRLAPEAARARGLVTASAGNMAQRVAWAARELGIPATIAVPEHAPQAKLAAIERLGGRVLKLPYDDWWQVIVTGRVEGVDGLFVHPVQDEGVMAGNGTIGLEILDDLPDPDAVVIPYGGGGLTVGIATALRALSPQTKVYAAEPETGAALCAALAAGAPIDVDYQPSFVDGAGSRRVLDPMWPLVEPLVDGTFAVPIDDAAAAVRLIAERVRVIAEGAGALAPAAALAGAAGSGKVVCIVSRAISTWPSWQRSSRLPPRVQMEDRDERRHARRNARSRSAGRRRERLRAVPAHRRAAGAAEDGGGARAPRRALFQTVHQSSELWLKLATTEVDEAAGLLERESVAPALRLLRRAVLPAVHHHSARDA